ncbi:hypothetical protein HY477_00005 [Candidatus Uhrbacteria bacterium]|nr:hypothetical protein [Candidatus Uhrbacteria bacterium]
MRIGVDGEMAFIRYGQQQIKLALREKSLVWGIAELVDSARRIKGIAVKIENATFSTTRQVVTAVNTLAWVLGIKVSGKNQLTPKYSGKPNITRQKYVA